MHPDVATRRALGLTGALLILAGLVATRPAPADFPPGRMPPAAAIRAGEHRPGELLIGLTADARIEPIAAALDARVIQVVSAKRHVYLLRSNAPNPSLVDLCTAACHLPGVTTASPNSIYRIQGVRPVLPNDTHLAQQWALRRSGAPEAHGIIIGQRDDSTTPRPTKVAILDSGVSPTHPDLQNQDFPDAMNFTSGVGVPGAADDNGHGTHVAGIAAALTNNNQGIASQAWDGVTILPVKVVDAGGTGSSANVTLGIDYAVEKDVDVINLALGSSTPDPVMQAAIQDAVAAGIVVVASSGNGRNPTTGASAGVLFPAAFDESIAVGAVGPDGNLAHYSDFGPQLDLVAPGGNNNGPTLTPPAPSQPQKEVFSTLFNPPPGNGDSFGFKQGTSMSAPMVAGAVAALLADHAFDATPEDNTRVDAIKQVLYSTATNPRGFFTFEYGHGELNLAAAIKASTEYIDLQEPLPNSSSPSSAETLLARLVKPNMPSNFLEPADFKIRRDVTELDGSDGEDISFLVTIVDPTTGQISFQPGLSDDPADPASQWQPGATRVSIKLCGEDGRIRSILGNPKANLLGNNVPAHDYVFSVVPKLVPGGQLRMFSVPYSLLSGADTIAFMFGGNPTTFARWVTEQNRYAVFNSLGPPQDPEANFTTNSMGVDNKPVGVGFWTRAQNPGALQILGIRERRDVYPINLQPGWTMVGGPYLSAVPLAAAAVEFLGETMSVRQAIQRRLIDPAIWSYNGLRYVAHIAPDGAFPPFDARWVHANQAITLLLPRAGLPVGRQPSWRLPALAAQGGWRVPISLAAGGRVCGQVVIGAGREARDGRGLEDLAAPPPAMNVADLRIARESGRYLQELRRMAARRQSWNLEVITKRPETQVSLTWGSLPRRLRLEVLDLETGRSQPLARGGNLTLRPGRPGVRRLRLTAAPVQ